MVFIITIQSFIKILVYYKKNLDLLESSYTLKIMKQIIEQLIVPLLNAIEKYNSRFESPSLLAYNIDWFTNCNWLTQITAFKRLADYK
jgi:hypothetical protein